MPHRNSTPRRILLAEAGFRGWRLGDKARKPGIERRTRATGQPLEPAGVWSTARLDSQAAKVGKVPRVAEACPHSEGVTYKRRCREIVACRRDWRMGSE